MRKHLLLMTLLMSFAFTGLAQKDQITFKDGRTIKRCTIYVVDTVNRLIEYREYLEETHLKVPINEVASFIWEGEVNKGLKAYRPPILPQNGLPLAAHERSSGSYLKEFANGAQTGIAMMTVGSLLSASSIYFYNTKPITDPNKIEDTYKKGKIVAGIGMGLTFVGFIVYVSSYGNARKAGIMLNKESKTRLGLTDSGVGITIPIK